MSSTLLKKTGRYSTYKAYPYWYIAATTKQLGKQPIRVFLWGIPLVLFRDGKGKPHALLDRCSHRNVPLSKGTVCGDSIQCPYHGWEFDGEGRCRHIPAKADFHENQARNVPSYPVREQQGHIWVYTDTHSKPNHLPYSFPHFDDPKYRHIYYQADFDATIHATAENILDVPHTAFLHSGLFRSGNRNLIETHIQRFRDRVDCEYIGEPRPTGFIGQILAPKGGEVEHFDRFILPSIAQVEYRLENKHLLTTSALSPLSDFKTRMFAVVSVKLEIWIPFLQSLVTPFALKIVNQDIEMLKAQTEQLQFFEGEQYSYTELDALGPSIQRLLKKAEKTPLVLYSEEEESVEMDIRSQMRV